jgi:hypothetical protein
MEIQLMIQQGDSVGGHADQEDANLAVVLLAEPAVVLPRHARGVRPLLGVGTLVDDAQGPDRRAERRREEVVAENGLALGLNVIVLSGGDADEILEPGDLSDAVAQSDRLNALGLGTHISPSR